MSCALDLSNMSDQRIQVLLGLFDRRSLRCKISIMETPSIDLTLHQKLEERLRAASRVIERVAVVIPRRHRRRRAKWVTEAIAHGVPVARSETQVLAHRFAFDQSCGVVVVKGQRIV